MARLNYRKPHVIHGAGPGKDVVVQDSKLYDRSGASLPPSLKAISEKGIPITNELHVHLRVQEEQHKYAAQRRAIDAKVAAVQAELERRARLGLPLEDPDESADGVDDVALEGLDELQASLENNVQSSRVRTA